MFQKKIPGQDNSTEFTFPLPIGSSKKAEITEFHPHAPGIKYLQDDKNVCCFGSLASDLFDFL